MFNPNWYYNPNCFNPQAYTQMQMQAQQHEQSQQKEVYNAVKAYKDFLDAMSKLDSNYQYAVYYGCLCEIAKHKNWQKQF